MESPYFGIKDFPIYLEMIKKKLAEQIPPNISGLDRLLRSNGKRLRPGLVIAIAHYNDIEITDNVINLATAVELVHLATLIHDDIIDNGQFRWGVETINSKEGSNMALLAGDYLIAKGCELATAFSDSAGVFMTNTITKLCLGQAAEITDRYNLKRTEASLDYSIKGKTSSLFIASCYFGGLLSGVNKKQLNSLMGFGDNLGLAFQYLDDVVDISKTENNSISVDLIDGNYTLPILLSLKSTNKNQLIKLLHNPEKYQVKILEILNKDKSIELTLLKADEYIQKAIFCLENLDNNYLKTELKKVVKQLYLNFR